MLVDEFKRIKDSHREALKKTAARVVLGPSVMRVYSKGTRDALLPVLSNIAIDELLELQDQEHFSQWFDSHVHRLARVVARHNPNNARISLGIKWGHATKIMALFVRDLVLSSRYFSDADAKRLSYFLHVPVDGIIIGRLRKLGNRLPFDKIKDIDTRRKFYAVQETLAQAAAQCGVPRVWFDDNWGDRQ